MFIEKICQRCGKAFFVKPSRISTAKYCSIKCRSPAVHKICRRCGKKFRVKPGRADERHYCSTDCYRADRKGKPNLRARERRPEFTCENCGKPFTRPPSAMKYDPPKFCSPECFYQKLRGSERAEYVDTNCLTCGQSIHIRKSKHDAGRGRYCSQECMITDRPAPPRCEMIRCTCQHCHKEFGVYPSHAKRGEGKFCSIECFMEYNGPTSIEQALMDELDRRQINYEFQYPLDNWRLDFAFPAHKLAVEADGIYWHSLDNVQKKDARKDVDLQSISWTVLHFTGDEIRKSPQTCVDKIVRHLIP